MQISAKGGERAGRRAKRKRGNNGWMAGEVATFALWSYVCTLNPEQCRKILCTVTMTTPILFPTHSLPLI